LFLLLFKVEYCVQSDDEEDHNSYNNCTLKSHIKHHQVCTDDQQTNLGDDTFCFNITYNVKVRECPAASQSNCTDSEKNTTRRVCIKGSTHCFEMPVSDEIVRCVGGSLSESSKIQNIESSSNVYISTVKTTEIPKYLGMTSVFSEIQSIFNIGTSEITTDFVISTSEIQIKSSSSVDIAGGTSEITNGVSSMLSNIGVYSSSLIIKSSSPVFPTETTKTIKYFAGSSVYNEIERIGSSSSNVYISSTKLFVRSSVFSINANQSINGTASFLTTLSPQHQSK
jgi:hypothetical protein